MLVLASILFVDSILKYLLFIAAVSVIGISYLSLEKKKVSTVYKMRCTGTYSKKQQAKYVLLRQERERGKERQKGREGEEGEGERQRGREAEREKEKENPV